MPCRRPLILISIVAAAAFSLLAAGCGGGSATTAATTTTATQNGALAYARCMRSHGVRNFPDPTASGRADKEAAVSALQEVGNSQAQAAQTDCIHVNGGGPGTGQSAAQSQPHTAAMLAFARCLRSHGFPNVPDPTSSGQLTPQMVARAGINLHQPALIQAADACVGVTHGVLTKADVARALNESTAAGQ
jgi:hypothetical protein